MSYLYSGLSNHPDVSNRMGRLDVTTLSLSTEPRLMLEGRHVKS